MYGTDIFYRQNSTKQSRTVLPKFKERRKVMEHTQKAIIIKACKDSVDFAGKQRRRPRLGLVSDVEVTQLTNR